MSSEQPSDDGSENTRAKSSRSSIGGALASSSAAVDGASAATPRQQSAGSRSRGGRSLRRRVVRWLIATFLLWCAAAGLTLYNAQKNAKAGEIALRAVADLDDPVEVDLDVMSLALINGHAELSSARDGFGSVLLKPLNIMPVIGRQLSSARAIVGVTYDVVDELKPIVEQARVAKAQPGEIERVAFLRDVSEGLARLEAVVTDPDLGPSERLVAPLTEARQELSVRLADLQVDVVNYRAITVGLASFLDGGSYLLLGSNNAEMRLGSGMHLSVGRLEMSNGEFELPGLEPADEIAPILGASTLDEDVDSLWGFLAVDDDFRKLGYSARFDEHVAPQALEFWRAYQDEELDGVVLLDPFVLVAMLEVVGGVEVDGELYTADNALAYLLQEQYQEFDDETFDETLVDARRDRLSEIASGVADAFGTSDWDPVELIRALRPVARGRHLMVYSVDPTEQASWETLNVAGRITGADSGVFWLNTGASKLDPFLSVSVEAETSVDDGERRVDVTVTSTNNGSADLPRYTVGPWESLELEEAGVYRGRLAFYAPNGTLDADFLDDVGLDVFGADGPVVLVATKPMSILPGETSTLRFFYTLPIEAAAVDILPSGRFPLVQWTWNGESFDDSERRSVLLESAD